MTAHYSPSAYQPARIPDQPAAVKRSWLFRFGSSRLPWGHTEDIVPHSMLSGTTPGYLREIQRREFALPRARVLRALRRKRPALYPAAVARPVPRRTPYHAPCAR